MKRCLRCSAVFAGESWECPRCGHCPDVVAGFPALAPELAKGGAGFPDAFAELADLEANNFWFRSRNRLLVWALRRHVPHMRRYLEIGCGTGYVLAGVAEAFPEAAITGSEVFSAGLPFAASRLGQTELLQMDARHIPYFEEFDAIGAFDVLEHIEEDEAVLSQMQQALKPGGTIVITVPQHPWLWSWQDEYAQHVRRYRVGELREKALRAGFEVAYATSFVTLLLPAMLASRMLHRRAQAVRDPLAELRLPMLLDRPFAAVMHLERLWIQMGVRFPVGGSLLLIAGKGAGAK